MNSDEMITLLTKVVNTLIKQTTSKNLKWTNAKEAMLETASFTGTTAYANYVKYNTAVGKKVIYEKSFFCELQKDFYLFLGYVNLDSRGKEFEFYSYTNNDSKFFEYPAVDIQPLLFRLYNVIVYGATYDSDEIPLKNISL